MVELLFETAKFSVSLGNERKSECMTYPAPPGVKYRVPRILLQRYTCTPGIVLV